MKNMVCSLKFFADKLINKVNGGATVPSVALALHVTTVIFPVMLLLRLYSNFKEKHGVWDPLPELTIIHLISLSTP
jgi:hypothetical protein